MLHDDRTFALLKQVPSRWTCEDMDDMIQTRLDNPGHCFTSWDDFSNSVSAKTTMKQLHEVFRFHFINPAAVRTATTISKVTEMITSRHDPTGEEQAEVSADAPKAPTWTPWMNPASPAGTEAPPTPPPKTSPLVKVVNPAKSAAARGKAATQSMAPDFVQAVSSMYEAAPTAAPAAEEEYTVVPHSKKRQKAPNPVMPVMSLGDADDGENRKVYTIPHAMDSDAILNVSKSFSISELWADSGCRKAVGGHLAHREVQKLYRKLGLAPES